MVQIPDRRKVRQSSIVPLSMQKQKGGALESYEQTVERPGPDSEPEHPTRHCHHLIVNAGLKAVLRLLNSVNANHSSSQKDFRIMGTFMHEHTLCLAQQVFEGSKAGAVQTARGVDERLRLSSRIPQTLSA